MEYPNLIRCVLANPVLANSVQEMTNQSGMLNLVDPEWENRLNSYPVHESHRNRKVAFSKGRACSHEGAHVRNVSQPAFSYKVIVLASFTSDRLKSKDLDTPPGDMSFVVRDCPPLTTIGHAMAESNDYTLYDGARLFMNTCNPNLCIHCKTQHKKFNIPCDVYKNWCVTKICLFDGQTLNHTFKKVLEKELEKMGQFWAICQVHIYSRTTFGERKYKVGGIITNLIVFQEISIQPAMDMTLLEHGQVPSIEFPTRDDEDSEAIINYPE
ncbi:hypothetical protein JTE90_016319 [Oedothorax gibbosus]|uniref:Uncharacterized protein n=1 Tax=Oedothorax gibbosus TaxID=931172 RepID=A0AAV6TPQ1_9ARAC|nr:hypothetical protein JTE90_016319 [Oedothorax gibbosus]